MTMRELSQLYWLRKEVEADRRRLAELCARAAACGRPCDGLPRTGGPGDPTGQLAARLADCQAAIDQKCRRCLAEQLRLESYIATIPDSLTRQIFTLRFVEGHTWHAVAARLGGGNTPEGVKKRAYRYLDVARDATK